MTFSLSPIRIAYGERPFRLEPGTVSPDSDIYADTPAQRAMTVRAALDAGITYFHAAYEREAHSLGQSLKTLGVRDQVTLSTTDGDVLDRCSDTEAGAAAAIRGAIARKRELLGVDTLDVFLLYDFRPETHTPARLAGARLALAEAQALGHINHSGVTCYGAYDSLADALEHGILTLDVVAARLNYLDQSAGQRLLPLCRSRGIMTLAAQPFSWVGGVPFVRFPNTWRFRNLTKNFYGFTAGQAHLYWLSQQPNLDGILVSMQTPEQIAENIAAIQITKTPTGLESLFDSFAEALTKTKEGWRGLLQDEQWGVPCGSGNALAEKEETDMSQEQAIRVGASAVIVRDNTVLLIGYDLDDGSGFHYNFPGGGVEAGEGLHQAVQREVWEEAGAEVEVGSLLFVTEYVPSKYSNRYGVTQKLSLFFRCALCPGSEPRQPQSPIDAQSGIYWVPLRDLPTFPLLPGIGSQVQAALNSEVTGRNRFVLDWQ